MRLARGFFAVVLLFVTVAVQAAIPFQYEYNYANSGYAGWFTSADEACQHYAGTEQTKNPGYTVTVAGIKYDAIATNKATHCSLTYKVGTNAPATVDRALNNRGVCPSGSTLSGGVCVCNAGTQESGGQCVSTNPCQADSTLDVTVRMGWGRTAARSDGALWKTSDGRTFIVPVPGHNPFQNNNGFPPGVSCDGTCAMVSDGSPGEWWYGTEANGKGLTPIYREQRYMRTGATCTAKDASVDPTDTGPACDGYLGQVNGQTKCIAKEPPRTQGWQPKPTTSSAGSGKPTPSAGEPQGPNGETPGKAGDKASQPDLGGTGTSVGDGVSGGGGGTPKPSTGTTTTTNPDGTTTTTEIEIDVETCGVPGKPACKIDESGTPDGKGFGDSDRAKLGEEFGKLDAALQSITSSSGKDTSWAMPGWFTHRGCQPWNLGVLPVINQPINFSICAAEPYVIGVTTFLWIVGTFLACLGMIENVMFGRSSVR